MSFMQFALRQEQVTVPLVKIGQWHGNIDQPPAARAVPLVQGAYSPEFIAQLKAAHVNVNEVPAATAGGLRGTLAAIAVDPKTGRRTAVDQPGVMVFNAAQ